jgi:dihydroorotate dehydrogenase (subfamily 1) family protein
VVKLETKIGKMRLKNPVMAASGTFGLEYGELIDINKLGAYITKTITLNARIGNPPPRLCETASGMLNSIGLENGGLDDFIKNKFPALKKLKIPLVVSIAGDDVTEFKELARALGKVKGIAALEINLSCPNVKHGKRDHLIAQDEEATHEVIRASRAATALTIIAKLSPNVTDIKKIARAAELAGADALSLINTLVGLAVDIEKQRPILGNVTGGLSGPAIKPVALRMVRETYNSTKIPIIGIGGITDYKDAVEFMLCGASAVQVGTANFVDPAASTNIISGLKSYMVKHKIKEIKELVGALKR